MKNKILAIAAAGFLVGPFAAHAVVIDFESLSQAGFGFNYVGTDYTEDGFQLTSGFLGFESPQTGNVSYFAGSTALFDNTPGGTITLTKSGGGTFSLASIDISEIDRIRLGPTPVNFTGNLAGGGTVGASFILDAAFGFETFVLGWSDLLSVTWQQSPVYHQFDNIVVDRTVPEPGSLALLGLGLAGLSLARRRKLN